MSEFTASNGIPVTLTDDGRLIVENEDHTYPAVVAAGEHVQAVREFFRHKEDERLGRWRWPENPEWIVYGAPECADYDVRVMCETSGDSMRYTRSEDDGQYPVGSSYWALAARAFFDAHPEPKPWENAKPGEVWELTVDGRQRFAQAGRGDFRHLFEFSDDESMSKVHAAITAGRKIWPEGAS